jgi:hypothetical protein
VRVARPVEREGRPDPELELPLLDPLEHVTRPAEQFVARQDVVVQARAREEERALDVQDLGVRRASRGRSQRATPVTSMTALTVRESFPRFYSLTPAPCALRSLLTWWLSSATRSPASQRASLTRPGVRPPAPEVGAVEYSPGCASGRGRPVPVSSPAGEAGAPGPTRPRSPQGASSSIDVVRLGVGEAQRPPGPGSWVEPGRAAPKGIHEKGLWRDYTSGSGYCVVNGYGAMATSDPVSPAWSDDLPAFGGPSSAIWAAPSGRITSAGPP